MPLIHLPPSCPSGLLPAAAAALCDHAHAPAGRVNDRRRQRFRRVGVDGQRQRHPPRVVVLLLPHRRGAVLWQQPVDRAQAVERGVDAQLRLRAPTQAGGGGVSGQRRRAAGWATRARTPTPDAHLGLHKRLGRRAQAVARGTAVSAAQAARAELGAAKVPACNQRGGNRRGPVIEGGPVCRAAAAPCGGARRRRRRTARPAPPRRPVRRPRSRTGWVCRLPRRRSSSADSAAARRRRESVRCQRCARMQRSPRQPPCVRAHTSQAGAPDALAADAASPTPVPLGSPSSLLRALPAALNAQQLWLADGSRAASMRESACVARASHGRRSGAGRAPRTGQGAVARAAPLPPRRPARRWR